VPRSLELSPGIIDLWVAHVPDWMRGQAIEELIEVLSQEEKDRARKFAFDRDRDVYHLAHGMLRIVLSSYDGRDPSDWRFAANRHGKPSIEGFNTQSLRFNISHTAGLAVVAVTRENEVGVDVESLTRTRVRIELASKAFAPIEREKLLVMDDVEAMRNRFFQIWTLKESFIKAMGRGLSLPLDQFWFEWRESDRPDFQIDPTVGEVADDWRFELIREVPEYVIAVATRAVQNSVSVQRKHFKPHS